MKAVVTVIGEDRVGILAAASSEVSKANANVIEVSQSVLQEYFAMIMLIDISQMSKSIEELEAAIKAATPKMKVHVMHEDIFNSMHRI